MISFPSAQAMSVARAIETYMMASGMATFIRTSLGYTLSYINCNLFSHFLDYNSYAAVETNP